MLWHLGKHRSWFVVHLSNPGDRTNNTKELSEVAAPYPIDDDRRQSEFSTARSDDWVQRTSPSARTDSVDAGTTSGTRLARSCALNELHVVSYLILFALLGTLARLGLQSLTFYPGAPVIFSEIWANFGGSLVIGFLSNDRKLFGIKESSTAADKVNTRQSQQEATSTSSPELPEDSVAQRDAKTEDSPTKTSIPIYIGLSTGFCGSFTSFSSFMRDCFLALSNNLLMPTGNSTGVNISRGGGYSFPAVLAVMITTTALCLTALHFGAHLAHLLHPITPRVSRSVCRRFFDPIAVFLAWGCWLGAILLSVFPPDRYNGRSEIWRGRAVFALVFAPLGCLCRFYISLHLNKRLAEFPLGTFVVNMLGTALLGMFWDLQHSGIGGIIGCQVLQGMQDGYCGCLTTVSTWVLELSNLSRKRAYIYGILSITIGFSLLVIVMGSLRWTVGFQAIQCIH